MSPEVPIEKNVSKECNEEQIGSCCLAAMQCFDRLNIAKFVVECPGYNAEKGCQGVVRALDKNERPLRDVGGPITALKKQSPHNFAYVDHQPQLPS
jgi:hypothetical protein